MASVCYWMLNHPSGARAGSEVFAWVHRVVLVAIWVLVPLMSCDCLSHEKRDGTLGLLFLTNLKAGEIVLAKAAAHGLRALTVWLAVVPIIGVPLLMGGLDWREIMISCCIAFGSICAALGLGLLASALSRRIGGAVSLATMFAPGAHVVFYVLVTLIVPALLARRMIWNEDVLASPLQLGVVLTWNVEEVWRELLGPMNKQPVATLVSVFCIPVAALLFLYCACTILIAPIIRRNWQDKPKTKRQTEVENFFCKPLFWTGVFRWWMRRSLERNPIGWLEKRSWSGRIASWVWLAVMISFASALAYTSASRGDFEGFNVLMWMLLASIAYVAAGSFRRERETGALELILVTPLSERQIISGRLRGLWSQFLPTFAIWVAVVLYLSSALKDWQVANIIRFTVAYLIVPVVGLYFSLRSRFVLIAWLATAATCFVVAQLAWWAFYYFVLAFFHFAAWRPAFESEPPDSVMVMGPALIALAVFLRWRLQVNLVRRSFSLR